MRLFSAGSVVAVLAAAGLVAASPAAAADPVPDIRFASVAAGNATSSAVTTDGALYTWGADSDGQLGTGGSGDASTPARVTIPGLGAHSVAASAEGAAQSLALLDDGRVFAWGRGILGAGGADGSSTPVEIPAFTALAATDPVVSIAAGDSHDIALTRSGQVYTWGSGRRGALGTGTTANELTPVDITANLALAAGEKATSVAAGFLSSVVVTDAGRVINWGGNVYGDLGDGTTIDRYTPAAVVIPGLTAGDAIVEASLFSSTTLVRAASGALYAWGSNTRGPVGNGTMSAAVVTPVAVDPLPGLAAGDRVVAVSAGQFSSLALTESGALYSWGFNGQGQLGDGTLVDRPTPTRVADLPAVLAGKPVSISMGGRFALVVTDAGEVLAWGHDLQGQLGDGAPEAVSTVPVTIALGTLSGSVAVEGELYTGLTVSAQPSTTVGDWHPAAVFQYQWLRDGVDIAGATAPEYTLVDEDAGAEISVQITGRAPNWAPASATSLPVSPVVGIAPAITSDATAETAAGIAFSHTITATGTPEPTITVEDLPAGITFDAATATLSGIFAAGGVYTIEITAANGIAPEAVQSFVVTVAPAAAIVVPSAPEGEKPAAPTTPAGTGDALAATGLDLAPAAAGALLALLAGAAVLLLARRRVRATR